MQGRTPGEAVAADLRLNLPCSAGPSLKQEQEEPDSVFLRTQPASIMR